ncbi:MAG: transcriptional regulator, partial [Vicinamibacterales bacterium]
MASDLQVGVPTVLPEPADGQRCVRFAFGPFTLDVGARQLFRDLELIPLTPRVFDTLWVLLRHHGRIVTKDEL